MRKTSFLTLILFILWLPFLLFPFIGFVQPSKEVLGYRLGWLCFLPMIGLTFGIWWQTLSALFSYKTNIILPNYRFFDALATIRRNGRIAALFLPAFGALGLLLLLPEYIQSQTAMLSLGLPDAMCLAPFTDLPTLYSPMLGFFGIALLYGSFALFVWRGRAWPHLLVVFLLSLFCFMSDPIAQILLFGSHYRAANPALMILLCLFIWFAMTWGWKWIKGIRSSQVAAQQMSIATLGLLVLGQFSCFWPQHSIQHLLAHLFPWLLGTLTLWLSALSFRGVRTLQKEAQFGRIKGMGAYLLGATWPYSLFLAWFGWLFFGGARFGSTLQHQIPPLFILSVSQILCFGAFSLLHNLHNTTLQPPNRTWLTLRPLLLYWGLFLPFGLPALALVKSVSW